MTKLETRLKLRKDCVRVTHCPVLFNIMADMLAILVNRAKRKGLIAGFVPHSIDDELSILQYC